MSALVLEYITSDTAFRWSAIIFVTFLIPTFLKKVWEIYILTTFPADPSFKEELPPGKLGYPVIGETIPFVIKVRTCRKCRIYRKPRSLVNLHNFYADLKMLSGYFFLLMSETEFFPSSNLKKHIDSNLHHHFK